MTTRKRPTFDLPEREARKLKAAIRFEPNGNDEGVLWHAKDRRRILNPAHNRVRYMRVIELLGFQKRKALALAECLWNLECEKKGHEIVMNEHELALEELLMRNEEEYNLKQERKNKTLKEKKSEMKRTRGGEQMTPQFDWSKLLPGVPGF